MSSTTWDDILKFIFSVVQQAADLINLGIEVLKRWWNSLPYDHALVAIVTILLIGTIDYLYRSSRKDFIETPEPNDGPRVRIVISNVFFTCLIGVFIVAFLFFYRRMPFEMSVSESIVITLTLLLRTIANLICEMLPRGKVFRFIGRLAILGGTAISMFLFIAEKLLG